MKKLLLVNPHPEIVRYGEGDVTTIPNMPLALGYLAALTPKGWEIDIIDEYQKREGVKENALAAFDNFNPDIVGITSFTFSAPRAYEIAKVCKDKNIPVAMGGMHATLLPYEAAHHADSVVIGDGLDVWKKVLNDFENGKSERVYNGKLTNPKDIYPDRELLRQKYGYQFSLITTTKGCPYECDFCCAPVVQEKKYMQREPLDVLKEMESTGYKRFFLTDENFYGNNKQSHERARNLFRSLIGKKIKWFGFTDLSIANDNDFLGYMRDSGCMGVLVGLESLDKKVLDSMNKKVNLRLADAEGGIDKAYKDSINKLHDYGIVVNGSIILGNDNEKPDIFRKATDFASESGIDMLIIQISTPLPRTKLHDRLSKEGRIFRNKFPQDWVYYDLHNLTFELNSMSLDNLIDGMVHIRKELYSKENLEKRFLRTREKAGLVNSVFTRKANDEWEKVLKSTIDNLIELNDSGTYPASKNIVPI